MNRYSEITPSVYNPMSLNELMMVPLMKRQQHNQTIAQQEAMKAEIGKLDPLDVHYNEAQKIKSDLLNKVNQQSEQLMKNGFSNDMTNNVIRTNREIQDLFSPTGRAGQINAAKKEYQKQFEDYLEDATKNKGLSREDALYNWEMVHKPGYTGYDETNNIKNINPYGAPKKLVLQEDLKTVKSLLGEETKTLMKNNDFHFREGPNGSLIVADGRGKVVQTTNIPQLNDALEYLNSRWVNPTGEGAISAKFERYNPNRIIDEINSGLGMMRVNKIDDNRETDYSVQGYSTKDKEDDIKDLEAVNVEGVSITRNTDLLSKLNGDTTKGGFITNGSPLTMGTSGQTYASSKTTKNEAVKSPEYKQVAYGVIKANPKLTGKKYDSPEVQAAVKKYLIDNKDVTVQNRFVDPNTDKTGSLFASKEIPKDKNAASALILERAQRGAYDVVDEEGNKIDKSELGKYNFTYNGDMTPKSHIGNKFENPKQNIGARTGVLVDKESGETKTVYISRSSEDFKTPQFKAMHTINSISKITDIQPNIYHRVKGELFNSYGLKNVEIKYNKNKDTYNIKYTEDGKRHHAEYDNATFQEFILNQYHNLGN